MRLGLNGWGFIVKQQIFVSRSVSFAVFVVPAHCKAILSFIRPIKTRLSTNTSQNCALGMHICKDFEYTLYYFTRTTTRRRRRPRFFAPVGIRIESPAQSVLPRRCGGWWLVAVAKNGQDPLCIILLAGVINLNNLFPPRSIFLMMMN